MKSHAPAMKAQTTNRRRAPRTARTRDPLFEASAVVLLVLLVFFVLA